VPITACINIITKDYNITAGSNIIIAIIHDSAS